MARLLTLSCVVSGIASALLVVYLVLVPLADTASSLRVALTCTAGLCICCIPGAVVCYLLDASALYPVPPPDRDDREDRNPRARTSAAHVAALREIVVADMVQ